MYIRDLEGVLKYWDLFVEGMVEFNQFQRAGEEFTSEKWMETILALLAMEGRYIIQLFLEDGEPMAFTMGYTYSTLDGEMGLAVYYVFARQRCVRSMKLLLAEASEWAKKLGATHMYAESRRDTPASRRWFEQKMGFTRLSTTYRKDF